MDISRLQHYQFQLASKRFLHWFRKGLFWLQNCKPHLFLQHYQGTNFALYYTLFRRHLRQLILQQQHVTNNYQQADTGTKMIHLGKNTKSTIISKGISAGKSQNSYRGLVQVGSRADNARNFSQCDSLLMGNLCGAHTFPYIEAKNKTAMIEHEATTSKIGEDQIFYCNQRGIDTEKAIALIVNGFSKEVLNKLPMEFAVEAQKLLEISLEGSVG